MKSSAILVLFAVAVVGSCQNAEVGSIGRYLQYRSMVRITKERMDVPKATRSMCMDPKAIYAVHYKPGVHIYANRAAIEARKSAPGLVRYPVGAIFVKEKFDSTEDSQPSIITVMEKLASEGKVDDWKFTMVRMSDRTEVREGFKVSCIDCHSRYPQSDFVSHETDRLMSEYAKR